MSKTEITFGLIKISIEDPNANITKLVRLSYKTIVALLPEARKVASEERNQTMKFQLKQMKIAGGGCSESDDIDSEGIDHPNSKVANQINRIYA